MRRTAALALACFILAPAAAAVRQSAPPPPADPPKEPPPRAAQPLPDLDDLLGLPPEQRPPADPRGEGADGEPAAPVELDPLKRELERKLSAQEVAQRFEEAVRQMGETADRIKSAGDVGIMTQRLQEQILKNLDLLIKSTQDPGSSGSSSSQQQQQQQQQGRPQRPTPQQSGQSDNQAGEGENQGQENMPPAMTDAERRAGLETARAAWGNLPERVRETLMQGSNDYFSALYEAMTEAYYRRIAEEAKEQ
jgi:hypothetical protein